jgi:hypothetical protein
MWSVVSDPASESLSIFFPVSLNFKLAHAGVTAAQFLLGMKTDTSDAVLIRIYYWVCV